MHVKHYTQCALSVVTIVCGCCHIDMYCVYHIIACVCVWEGGGHIRSYRTLIVVFFPGRGAVYSFDPVGSYQRDTYKAGGSASAMLQPLLDNQVKSHDAVCPG